MRRLFITLAKLLGLYEAYRAVQYLTAIISMAGFFRRPIEGLDWDQLVPHLIGSLVFLGVTAALAWLLLCRTERLADALSISKDDEETPELTKDDLFRVGIKLLGLSLLATSIPGVVRAFASAGSNGVWSGNYSMIWSQILPSMLSLVIAIMLTLRTSLIIDTLARWECLPGKRLAKGGVFALLLLVLLAVVAAKVAGHWDPTEHYRSQRSTHQSSGESVTDHHPAPTVEPEFYVVTNALSKTNAFDAERFTNIQDGNPFPQPQYQPGVTSTSAPAAKTTIYLSIAP